MSLNKFQRAAAKVYGGGDFSHVQNLDETKDVGDGLFSFLMSEISDKDIDIETVLNRLGRAIADIEDVIFEIVTTDDSTTSLSNNCVVDSTLTLSGHGVNHG